MSLRWAPWAGVGVIVAALCLLQGAVAAGWVNAYVVPPPADVLASLPRLVAEEGVAGRFLLTAGETLGAAGLALAVGLPGGLAMHRWPVLRAAFEPWVAALAAAPLVLAYPLFLVLFGRSALTIVMIAFASALPPVVLKTAEGLAATRRVLIDVGRSFRLRPGQAFRLVLLPSALPQVFVGLRLALVFALINVVGVEFLIDFGGLGQLIEDLSERYDLAGTWGAIGVVVLVSVALFSALGQGERWLRRRA